MAPAKYGREGSVFGDFWRDWISRICGLFWWWLGPGASHTPSSRSTLPCRQMLQVILHSSMWKHNFSSITITPRHIQRLLLRLGSIVSFTLKTPLSRLGAEERAQWLRAPFLAEVLHSVPSTHPARVSPWRQARPWRHTCQLWYDLHQMLTCLSRIGLLCSEAHSLIVAYTWLGYDHAGQHFSTEERRGCMSPYPQLRS